MLSCTAIQVCCAMRCQRLEFCSQFITLFPLYAISREKLTNPTDDDVAFTAGKVTTSKGPGTALQFALELGEQLFGKEARDKIQSEMLA
jgi:hypothetical protein